MLSFWYTYNNGLKQEDQINYTAISVLKEFLLVILLSGISCSDITSNSLVLTDFKSMFHLYTP